MSLKDQLAQLVQSGQRLLSLPADSTSPQDANRQVREFAALARYTMMGCPLNTEDVWYRARRLSGGESVDDHLREVLYRFDLPATYGRAHSKGNRTFYAAWNPITALAETHGSSGDRVWLAHVRPQRGATVPTMMVGVYEQFYRSGRVLYPAPVLNDGLHEFFRLADLYERYAALYADSVFAAILRAPSSDKYFLSSALAEFVNLNFSPSAFLFPSVRSSHSFNLALSDATFDDYFEVLAVERMAIEVDMGDGLALFGQKSTCNQFSDDGHIHWDSPYRHAYQHSFQVGRKYHESVIGWKVPPSWAALKDAVKGPS